MTSKASDRLWVLLAVLGVAAGVVIALAWDTPAIHWGEP